jgi:GNAT superfamily N-acetyltransferase
MYTNLTIRPVLNTEAKLLSDLAKEIYIPHYPYLWEPGGVEWYINEFAYPVEKIQLELNDENNLHFIAWLNEEPVGYLKININTKTKGYDSIEVMELERIYLYQNSIQKGLGKQLMQFVIALAKEHNKKTIVLKAMDSAKLALQFYQKFGFKIVRAFRLPDTTFCLMKTEYRGMLVLELHL